MTTTTTMTAIRTANMSGSDILNLKHRLEKYGEVKELNEHLFTAAPDRAIPQILTRFYDEVFAKNNASRLDKTIHYRDSDGIWSDVHPFMIDETSAEYVKDFESDYSCDAFRAQLDQVLVI